MDELAISGIALTIIIIGGLLYLLFIGYTIYHLLTKNRSYLAWLWILLILFFPLIGPIIYWVVYNTKTHKPSRTP